MTKLKIVEIVVLAATAFLTAMKSILKFIDYIGKIRPKAAPNAA